MKGEQKMTNNLFDPNDSYAQSFVKLVREELNDIKRQFFKIGFRLAEANREGYYQELGYENIAECAEDLFGFKKTTTYDLISVYNDFHDRLAPMTIKKEYDKYSQSQLVQLTGNIWARDSFIKYVQPEDTIDTIKKAKKLWNKIYSSGKTPGYEGAKRVEFKTLQNFIDIYWNKYYTPALPAPAEKKDDFSGQTEKFIEVEAVDAEPQGEDPKAQPEDFSGQTEKFGSFCHDSILHFLNVMDFHIGFGGDKKTPGTRVVPDFFSEEILRALARAIEKDRTKVKHTLTDFMIKSLGSYKYEIKLNDRKQDFSVFCGMFAGILTDYLIKEFRGKESKH